MATPIYTAEQVAYVLDARNTQALEYKQIAAGFASKWGGVRTSEQMRHLWRSASSVARGGPAVAAPRKPTREDARRAAREARESKPKHPLQGFTRASFSAARRESTKTRGRWLVTAASPVTSQSPTDMVDGHAVGSNLHRGFWDAMQTWAAQTEGELVVLPMHAHMPALRGQPAHYDPLLEQHRDLFASEYIFNEHLRALDVHLNPQQVSPLTGLHRLRGGRHELVLSSDGRRTVRRFNTSLVVAHAKQDLEVVATGNGTVPRLLHATGACTHPEYLRNRIGRLATEGHVVGGLVVEVDADRFWIRQVQASDDGSFIDLGIRYRPDGGTEPVRAEAMRLGDLHIGRHSPEVLVAWEDISDLVSPRRVFVEDVFDGGSVSHHKHGRGLTTAQDEAVFASLREELDAGTRVMDAVYTVIVPSDAEMLVVDSNHHEHLARYLDEGRYLRDKPNYELAHRMVVEILDGVDPLRSRLDPSRRYRWLGAEEDFFVEGIQMAAHGHLGLNGMRGSPAQMERIHAHSMTGHTHTPSIRGGAYVVGHSSQARHGYNHGPSTWLNCCGLVWPGGGRQLVVCIDGRFRLDDGAATEEASED